MKIPMLTRRRTRRERLMRRMDDAVGTACWLVTAWYLRQLRAEILRRGKALLPRSAM